MEVFVFDAFSAMQCICFKCYQLIKQLLSVIDAWNVGCVALLYLLMDPCFDCIYCGGNAGCFGLSTPWSGKELFYYT